MYKITLVGFPIFTPVFYYETINELIADINSILLQNLPFVSDYSEIIIGYESDISLMGD